MDTEEQKNVAIITPYQLILRGLDSLLENCEKNTFVVTGTAQTPTDALELFARKPYIDVALIDLAMGDCDPNLGFISRVREAHSHLPIVTLSHSHNSLYVDLVRSVGAQEHVNYHCLADTLCESLQSATRAMFPVVRPKQFEFDALVLPLLPFDTSSDVPPDGRRILTRRQYQTYVLLGEGKNYHEIARSLGIQPASVAVSFQLIARRLGFDNVNAVRYHAIHRAVLTGLEKESSEKNSKIVDP